MVTVNSTKRYIVSTECKHSNIFLSNFYHFNTPVLIFQCFYPQKMPPLLPLPPFDGFLYSHHSLYVIAWAVSQAARAFSYFEHFA